MEKINWYQLKADEIFEKLSSSPKGLNSEDAAKRKEEYGKNELTTSKKQSPVIKFLLQFRDVFMIVLMVAAGLSFFIKSYRDGFIMLIIAIINAVIGFLQEYKAEKIMESLKKLVQSPSKVLRNGEFKEIHQSELVPGDIISLDEGDKVPADIRIIESFNLRTNDVSLTGESMPQDKHSNVIKEECGLADRDNMVYLGTTVAAGNAKGIVTATGMNTEMGKIANLTQEEEKSRSPLQIELQSVANRLTFFAIIIAMFLFIGSALQGLGINFALIYALGIAVAVVPQALPMQITVALTQGVNRLAKENAVVKKLSSVETLGSTDVICTDKTGTLTKNEMTVKELWFSDAFYKITGLGYKPEGSIQNEAGNELSQKQIQELEVMLDSATMASNATIHPPDENHDNWYPIGDPTEAALITLSSKLRTYSPKEDEENPELHEFSFDSVRKRMSSIRQFGEEKFLTMKGATDSILSISKHIWKHGKKEIISEADKKKIEQINESYSRQAMRVIAIAHRKLEKNEKDFILEDIEKDVIFLGLVAMTDPPKQGVKEAIDKAHEAHISTFIMTGDHAITAQAIGKEINLSAVGEDVPVVTGKEFTDLSDEELNKIMIENDSLIFSRVSPEDKLRIVKLLKNQDKIVAVTGDGVNDAPALKSAHIGVAMGQMGTDVSKQAAELVLLDDSFPTLVKAIREGRIIYNNLRKTVLASLTSNGAELTVVLLGLLGVTLFNWPIPILAIQILAIDLFAEILPLTALTFDPGSKELMSSPPRSRTDHIINKRSSSEIIFLGLLMGLLAFMNFGLFIKRMGIELTSDHILYARATTICYTTIAFTQFINIMSRRYELKTIFSRNFFSNPKILYSILFSISICLIAIYTPGFNDFLSFAPLRMSDWISILAASAIFLIAHEIIKILKNSKISENKEQV
ncbi:MAG: cation-transporting P-type ATPase [Candidatus Cloacimonetes bacterium]|nr:cation-transporting P-type ATPase [Candidatus Cloacimonadota bacterium]MCF7815405.1 cation-transporting P-type ATPase [Candidatus Cloacimonadota bacterium]MCF7884851.1 cation-transporting P-type ATPase [Candidatus Cloacimonadota bacterium]